MFVTKLAAVLKAWSEVIFGTEYGCQNRCCTRRNT